MAKLGSDSASIVRQKVSRMPVFQIILTAIVLLFSSYFYLRGVRPLADLLGSGFAYTLAAVFALGMVNLLWLPWVHWRDGTKSRRFDRALEIGAHVWMGFFSVLLFTMLIREVALLGAFVLGASSPEFTQVSAAAALGATFLLFLLGTWTAARGPRIVPVTLTHPAYRGEAPLRVVQISDLHIGTHIGEKYVENVVQKVNSLTPDLIVFTGDIADGDPESHDEGLHPLRGLKSRFGSYYCTGNHEYYWNETAWMRKFSEIGLRILDNAHETLRIHGTEVAIAGVNDIRPNHEKALQGISRETFTLLLAHRPAHVRKSQEHPIHIQLSGHTHAGQFLPWSLIIRFFERFPKGRYAVGELILYVNVGTGFWGPPMRLGTVSEISMIEIRGGNVDSERA